MARIAGDGVVQGFRTTWKFLPRLALIGMMGSPGWAGDPPRTPPKGPSALAPLGPGQSYGTPQRPPVPGADPSVRHSLKVQVPTRLKIEKKGDLRELSLDPTSMEPAEITVGLNMLLGVKNEYRWRFAGDSKVQGTNTAYSGGATADSVDFGVGRSQQKYVPGAKVVIEVVVSVFETDIPPGFLWSPQSGQYKVLWTRTLSQPVE